MNESISKETLIGIMAKYPQDGKVKTRLVPPLTYRLAAELYEAILLDTIDMLNRMYFKKALFYYPTNKKTYFDRITGKDWLILPQSGKGLGQRLKNALLAFGDHKFPVLIIGSDSPAFPVDYLLEAILLLNEGNDLVLGPAEDGGFYLIGVKEVSSLNLDDIFKDIRWSTSHVLEDIKKNINKSCKRLALTGEWFDLDTEDDLKKTIAWFNIHNEDSYRNTRAHILKDK